MVLRPLLLVAVLALASSTAHAQDDQDAHMDPELVAKLLLGLGGDIGDEGPAVDLEPTLGGAVHYEHPLHRYIVLGGYLGLSSWNTTPGSDIGYDRTLMLDISVLPKLRLPIERELELYLAIPAGLTLDFASGEDVGGDSDTGTGYNLQLLIGGQLGFTDGFGLMGEMGYAIHSFSHSFDTAAGALDVSRTMRQFVISLGVYFGL